MIDNIYNEYAVSANDIEEESKVGGLKSCGQADYLCIFVAAFPKQARLIVPKIYDDKFWQYILPIFGSVGYDVNYLFVCKNLENGD